MARALITAPKTAKRGDVIELRALIQHPMETGYRRSSEGDLMPRDLIRTFTCRFIETGKTAPGETVFAATLHAAVAANPYLLFHFRVNTSGTLTFEWAGDRGFAQREEATLTVDA